ncbi:tripartite tricarboxylate transporter substrate binding protein [Variovorax sp. 770b2]|uniref:Bug family tripartite tricarboxylate transporter substrate binding protein n=1 Tax=Variovorax sp. 770b2 TaxID=1566271 RepID=UPI0008E0EFB2|nr:tripartite tricarboxylate transporter substrate binding protein [Variovorax sp. 770b2]SFP25966.1 Tripartite-type tricarboxylate transporter, receptor component TctC [Variovorax sp. 770b2]
MISRRHLVASAALAALPFGTARADSFPGKPIRIVVPFAAGGTGDLLCRTMQEPLQRFLGQPVIVENRLGASGSVGTQHVKNAAADGYTLLQVGNSTVTTALMQKAAGYDAIRDLAAVANIATTPMVFLLNPVIKADSIAELIAYAKPRPGELEYASAGRGSLGHLTNELFNQMAGLKMVYVPYQGSSQATNAVLAGEVKVVITTPSDAINAFVATGKLRMLGVSSPQRSPLLPGVPAIAETLPGFGVNAWFGLAAPAGTPPAVLARLNEAVNKAVSEPAMQEKLKRLGMTPAPGTSAAFAQTIRSDQQIWIKVMQQAGLSPE